MASQIIHRNIAGGPDTNLNLCDEDAPMSSCIQKTKSIK